MAGTNAKLPGVAYVSVLNNKGVVIAGILGDSQRFSSGFMQTVKEKGFPKEIVSQNPVPGGAKESAKDVSIDGHKIHDVAVSIGETGGETHVGLFTEDVEAAVNASLVPLVALLMAIAFLGSLSFIFVARTISAPIRSLTEAAEKISLGDIDLPIEVKGKGEIGELAASLERMRFSIKAAMHRMRRN
jgi:HAMP domain-containing protein